MRLKDLAVVEFRMPSLGADMDAGTLVEWLVKRGQRVKRGDIVAVVETQKGAIEIEIFETGIVDDLLVDPGATVPVGKPLARILTDQEAKQGKAAERVVEHAAPMPSPAVPTMPPTEIAAPIPRGIHVAEAAHRLRASPAARRLAQRSGVDLATIKGSGPGGAIIRADVEQKFVATVKITTPTRAAGLDLNAMRAAIAAAMARSKREIPHYYLEHQVDVTPCEQWLADANAKRPPEMRLLMGVLSVKAVALAAQKFQAFNGFFREGRYEPASAVHVGVAIAIRGGGLVAPAIQDTVELGLDELMVRMRDLVQRARAGRIRSSEFADPTITVSSLGERGVETLYGVIYPPQVAIVGFGKVAARPWIVDDQIAPRSVVSITLSADHRASDGHGGALLLAEIGKLLQEPGKL